MKIQRCDTCFGYFTDPEGVTRCPVCHEERTPPSDLEASIHALSADFASLSATIESMQSRLVTLNRLATGEARGLEVRPHGR